MRPQASYTNSLYPLAITVKQATSKLNDLKQQSVIISHESMSSPGSSADVSQGSADPGRGRSCICRQLADRLGAGWCRMALAGKLGSAPHGLSSPRRLVQAYSHGGVYIQEGEWKHMWAFPNLSIKFAFVPLASHLAKPRVRMEEAYKVTEQMAWTQGGE